MNRPSVVVPRIRKTRRDLPSPYKPDLTGAKEEEFLSGVIQNTKASAPEERFAKSLMKAHKNFAFRYTLGAPRNMPGFKEVDFVVEDYGMIFAFEMDTDFTHRLKGRADKLHDAEILAALEKAFGNAVWPEIRHLDGDQEFADQKGSDAYTKRLFG